MEKLVSVCINCYNSEKTILNTVNSVLNQTYKNLQVIVVDDCSTDNSVGILKAINDPRIEIHILEENGGISNCNNETFKYVKGDYVAHLDSDDIWLPEKIEKQVDFLENNKDYGACFTYSGIIDENGEIVIAGTDEKDTIFNYKSRSQAEYIRLFFEESNHFHHSSFFVRKEILDKLGNHNLTYRYLHDYDLWVRLVQICPVYCIEEPLMFARICDTNHSFISGEDVLNAHTEESARINYDLINNCPDGIFAEAFADKFKLSGPHTHEELELERAFILFDCLYVTGNKNYLANKKLNELLRDKSYLNLAKEKFGFSVNDLYELHKQPLFYNNDKTVDSVNRINILTARGAELQATLDGLAPFIANYTPRVDRLLEVRLYRILRRLKSTLKEASLIFSKKLHDGKKAKTVYTVFGFFANNLGDNLFFDILFNRYPDTLFKVVAPNSCFEFFSKYNNVQYFDESRKLVQLILKVGAKLKKENAFERLLVKTSKGAIHIGGSIYQQICDWENDLKIRKYRLQKGKEYYSLSSNFGPYTTSYYYDFWKEFFKDCTDISFRDRYSYNLYKDIKSVRYCPDLLFSFKYNGEIKDTKHISVSVIDTYLKDRNISSEISKNYENTIADIIKNYSKCGYTIDLLSFCEAQGDSNAIDRLIAKLPNIKINKIVYDGTDFAPVLNSIATSEIVVASRFHAMVLGYVLGKKVLSITYSKKTDNVLYDLALDTSPLTLNSLGDSDRVFKKLNALAPIDVSLIKEQADSQFSILDSKISKRHGTVNK